MDQAKTVFGGCTKADLRETAKRFAKHFHKTGERLTTDEISMAWACWLSDPANAPKGFGLHYVDEAVQ